MGADDLDRGVRISRQDDFHQRAVLVKYVMRFDWRAMQGLPVSESLIEQVGVQRSEAGRSDARIQ